MTTSDRLHGFRARWTMLSKSTIGMIGGAIIMIAYLMWARASDHAQWKDLCLGALKNKWKDQVCECYATAAVSTRPTIGYIPVLAAFIDKERYNDIAEEHARKTCL